MGLISMKWEFYDFLFVFTTFFSFSYYGFVIGARVELEGPSLLQFPDPVTYFSNSVGTTLSCLGKGHPPLAVSWLSLNGELLPQIPGLRESLANGSLSFGSFRFEEYSADIHNSQFQCAVSNPMGTFLSPIITIRAILDTPFELFIGGLEDSEVVEGNPVILHCNISPSSYANFVRVITWKSVDQFGYQTQILSDGTRYHITSRGSLIIFSAKYQQQLYVCVAQNTLNKKTQSSPPFLVKSTQGPSGGGLGLPPKTSARWEQSIQAEPGRPLDLTCSAAANSPLQFRWEKLIPNSNSRLPVPTGHGIDTYGPVLSFTKIEKSHNGTYRCEVSNTFGSIVLDFHVLLPRPPILVIEPKRKFLHRIGSSLELTCKIIPQQLSPLESDQNRNSMELTWYKNGRVVFGQGPRLKIAANKLLLANAQLDDQGVYQCFGLLEGQSFQASTEIVFEATPPELQQTFITQSLQPGPTVSLKCSATGNPFPELKWYVDEQELVSWPTDDPLESRYWQISDRYSVGSYRHHTEIVSHVNISNVRVEDSGSFHCTASNLLGVVVHSARLNVYGPLFVKDMPSLTLVAEETALVPCMYGGYPVDKITWQKNSKDVIEVSANVKESSRFSVLPNGTLRIDKINSDGDKGQYTCLISNRKGETATGTVEINVMHPPVISFFSFDDNLMEGQRTSAMCNVVSGDLPIDIKWLKDYQFIPSMLNITEMRVKFLSYLIFEELVREHSGTYICSASNGAATTNHSAVLSVKVPPYWIQEPQDVKVILRSSHVIPCAADGVPKPVIKWFRDTGIMKLPVQNDRKFEILEDGSLKLEDVEAMDGSNYVCEASNGVGTGLGKSIRLHVNIPAKVSAPMTSVAVAEGLPTLFKCHIRGDLPIQVEWRKNSIVISEQSPRFFLETILDGNSSLLQAHLHIERTERSDSGLYVCIASNHYGRDEDRISLEVKARPPAPEDFTVEEIGSRFIRLKWSPGPQTTSTAPVTYFVLQFKKSGSPSWVYDVNNVTVQFPSIHAVLEPLNPVTNYDIRILASNEIGHSIPTEPLAVLTLPEAPSGPPLNISALPVSSKSVLVRWDSPNALLQHGTILGYHVFASLQPNNHPGTNNTTVVDEKLGQQTEIHGLKSNSQYRISIRAYNSAGMGPDSPYVYVQTPEGVPDAPPQNVQCEGLSSRSLHIQWDPPTSHLCNGQIQGYKVIYQSIHEEKYGEKPEVKKTSNRETTLHGLQSFTNYSVRTLAFTLGGEGVVSVPLFCLTEEDIPDEPADLKVLSTSASTALVTWLPPIYPNGIIRKYTVYWKADDMDSVKEKSYAPSGSSDEEELSLDIRRLKENQKYTFWVTGTTSAGTGKSSKLKSVLISSKVGSRIATFTVIRNTVLDQPVLLNCKAIGVPPPKLSWLRNNRVDSSHHLMRNGSLFISRVKESDEGHWTCRAENVAGTDEVVHQIILNRPPSVVPLFLGYVSSTSVQIHWEPPQKSDPPVTGYVLHFRRESLVLKSEDEWEEKRLNYKTTSYTLENIHCGTVYLFRIAAENLIGLGSFSTVLKTKTNGQKPDGDPKLNDILDGNGTTVQIDLTRWPTGGCPLKNNFQIEYKPRDSPIWQRIYRLDNHTRKFTYNAVTGTSYELRITLENEAGGVTKLFEIDSSPEFFGNYEKMMKEKGRLAEERSSRDSFLTEAHVVIVVPIVSAVICTCAIGLCVLIIRRRRGMASEEWKFAHSTSQHTWLSSEDGQGGPGKLDAGGNNGGRAGGNMSVYATLNSAKPIPMEIRDSTVRFQTFGQRDNYEAPPVPTPNYKKYRRKSGPSSSPPDGMNLEVSCISSQNDYSGQVEPRNYRYYEQNSDSDDTEDSLYPDYARPYQHTGFRRGPDGKASKRDSSGKNTAGRKKQISRSRGSSREYLE